MTSKINLLWGGFALTIGLLCFIFGYQKGSDNQIIKTVIEEREVIKTIYVKSNEIESQPNKTREQILKLMKENKS